MKLGLLSTARINGAILRGANLTDAVDVVAVGSRDLARASAYAREHGIARAHGSYEELLADPDLDAVYISLPNSLHVEWSFHALEAGKHVLCEKPLDRHPAQVERVFDAAERNGLIVMEGFMYRHHPQTQALQELVASGGIGELRQIRSLFSFTLTDPANVRLRADLAGGALMDVGCYCVSGSRLLAGEPEVVVGRQVSDESGVDVRFDGILQFPGEVLAQFYCAFDLPHMSALEAVGSDGSVLVREPWHCRDPHLEVNGTRIDVPDIDRYQLELENFAAAARGETAPRLGREDAVAQARVIDALYRSAESGSSHALTASAPV